MKPKSTTEFWDGAADTPRRPAGPREQSMVSSSLWKRFSAWLAAQVCRHLPEGYEDEDGFHYGARPLAVVPRSAVVDLTEAGPDRLELFGQK